MSILNNKELKDETNTSAVRIVILSLAIFLFGAIIIARLFFMQVVRGEHYVVLAAERQAVSKSLAAERGTFYIREGTELFPLVTNREYYQMYAEPVKVQDSKKIIDSITPILDLEEAEWREILQRLNKAGDPYEPLRDKVTKQQKQQIEDLALAGLGFVAESKRYYPEANIGGHIFGFVKDQDGKSVGQYGLEGYFNQELAGKVGLLKSFKDALGSLITIGQRSVERAEDGVDLVLTIDRNVQFTACQKLKEFYDWFKADSGTVIIMEPTGAILAMCSFPDFNPEKFNEVEDINHFNNPAIFQPYEPGSVFKMVTMAAGLDQGAVEPDTTYVDEGEVKVGDHTIRNFDRKAHGKQTMTQVLENSLNTGVIFVEQKIGKDTFRDYVKRFGFGKKTGIELETETAGDVSSLDKRGDIFGITASYGQGVSVTPLQMINAFAAIANQGVLMKPYIVAEIIHPDGKVEKTEPKQIRQVVTPKTAALINGMLTSVTELGYDKKGTVDGYYLAGKTGTAEVAGEAGGYSASKTNHTFVGYGPVTRPKFVMLVKLDNPKDIRFASESVAPLFGQLAEFLLNYYQIQPDY